MKPLSFLPHSEKPGRGNQIAVRGGAYSLAITAIVLVILVVVNILASVLPKSMTRFDVSATNLYSITSNTKVVVNALDKDVTIYWVVQADKEDAVIENLLDKYESLSPRIKVVKKNPDVYPTFTAQYTDEKVPNNSLIVECGDKSRYIGYDKIYLTDVDYTTYTRNASFDGEGAITSAIAYVVSEELPQVYVLQGHGEAELPASFSSQLERENMETVSFSLLNENAIPDAADCILINAPASDISTKEKDLLADYLAGGGKLMVLAGPTEDGTLENLYSLLADYGVEAEKGVVIEGDRSHYAFQSPYTLLPDLADDALTRPLMEEHYFAIMPIAQGLSVGETQKGSVTKLLTTSDASFSKLAGYDLNTFDKEPGDIDGPFAVAVSVSTGNGGQMVWFASSHFLDDAYNAYSSGANLDLTMNALSSLVGETDAVSIRSKSLNYNYLTINDAQASFLQAVMIGVLPIAVVALGIAVSVERRRRRDAQG